MRILFLDDNPARLQWATRELKPGNQLVLVETATQAIEQFHLMGMLPSWSWDLVFLDHDLGGTTYADPNDPNTGSGVVRWIVANRPKVDWLVVHSLNAPAANGMVASLRGADYHASYINFLKLVDRVDNLTELQGAIAAMPRGMGL